MAILILPTPAARKLSLLRKIGILFLSVLTPLATNAAEQPPLAGPTSFINGKRLPASLEPWGDWVNWHKNDSPTAYDNSQRQFNFWPTRLGLDVQPTGARFDISVQVFHEDWVPLPGGGPVWPMLVKANGLLVPVILHDKFPGIRLARGQWRVEGVFRWTEIPQRIAVPTEIGMLALSIEGKPVEFPAWNAEGTLFLRRDRISSEAEKDFLSVKIYRVIEDGIPMWLRTEMELSVSGKSREEDLGGVLPTGWSLASVTSPLPTLIDATGRMKVQVRPGKWTIQMDAFRANALPEMAYATGLSPAVTEELVAFQAKPDFRMVEVMGIPPVDVSQTTFPAKWGSLPVYRWETQSPFTLVERQRGMGLQRPEGLKINRQMWLDENGKGFTFRDHITGTRQQIWRLDAAPGQELGAVQDTGQGQLITRNPETKAPGVEIRSRALDISATGRMVRNNDIQATGWLTDADSLSINLQLPPGWRLFALFGADDVEGDWLTAWSLLDLFLLLIFSLAVFRLWGFWAGLLAFAGFGISFHEPGAPRYLWLALLIPVALLRVVPAGWGHRLITVWKWLTVLILIFILAPFVTRQVQYCLYPQLELERSRTSLISTMASDDFISGSSSYSSRKSDAPNAWQQQKAQQKSNLFQAASARIQTGPGVPNWSWRSVQIKWNGPVQSSQKIHPILIPLPVERTLMLLRVLLLLGLAGVLLGARRAGGFFGKSPRMTGAVVLLSMLLMPFTQADAQFPDEALLKTLRERLNPVSDAYPHAADIPNASLEVLGNRLILDVEIHTAISCAVPLPGRLPVWSPGSVTLDGQPATALRREDGYLWLVVPQGVHQVRVEGMFPVASDWEWAFALKPRHVTVKAPDWNVSGLNAEGAPESQVFFSVKQKTAAGEASYDRQELQSLAVVERHVEMGLVWQVHTSVKRLSPKGKAVELRIPLLPGERVLSSNRVVQENRVEVRLGANDEDFSWESELTPVNSILLKTNEKDVWVERWSLVASPVWNLAFTGIAPQFNQEEADLVPVWSPWPGEQVTWTISRPEAEKGATVTIDRVQHEVAIGSRQRVSDLTLSIRSSLGEDFSIGLPTGAEITTLTQDNRSVPVRMDAGRVVLPLHPGAQEVQVKWKTNVAMKTSVQTDEIRLPVESANVQTTLRIPEDRWVLWTAGPMRGPAVRFWGVLICTLLAGWALGRVKMSPLKPTQWMLLTVGLTQVPLAEALIVAGWLFLLTWRGSESFQRLSGWVYNLLQLLLAGLTAVSLIIFVQVVGAGLLGSPEMFILGNGSSRTTLMWYQDRCGEILSRPGYVAISIWWYRLLMLAWALWLAVSLLKWLWWGWRQFSSGGAIRKSKPPLPKTPPPLHPASN